MPFRNDFQHGEKLRLDLPMLIVGTLDLSVDWSHHLLLTAVLPMLLR